MPKPSRTPDLSEFFANAPRTGAPCKFDAWVATLPAERRERLEAALATLELSDAAIHRTIREWGAKLSESTVTNYRKRKGLR